MSKTPRRSQPAGRFVFTPTVRGGTRTPAPRAAFRGSNAGRSFATCPSPRSALWHGRSQRKKELRDLSTSGAAANWHGRRQSPFDHHLLFRRRPAGNNQRGASFSPRRQEGLREPLRRALPLGVRMQEGASRPAYLREAHLSMAEGNAGRNIATSPPPAQPQTGMDEVNPPSITIFCFDKPVASDP